MPRHHGRRRLFGGRHGDAVHDAVDLEGVRLRDGARGSGTAGRRPQGGSGAERRRFQLDQPRSPNWCAAESDDQCRCNRDRPALSQAIRTDGQWRRIEDRRWRRSPAAAVPSTRSVYRSESGTGFRNRAIAWMLKNFGIIDGEPMATLENYFRQCSLLVDCRDLACMAATLANGGVHPSTGQPVLAGEHVERVLSVMATCGMYDYAGSWLYEVGMPAKSGVSGGIIAVVPGRFGIGIYLAAARREGQQRARHRRLQVACRRDLGLHVFTRTASPDDGIGPRLHGRRRAVAAPADGRNRAWLNEHARRIKYLCLHGVIAVDGAEYIIRRMREMAPDTQSFILDMHEAIGISDSAARLLNQARLGFADDGIAVVCSRIRDRPTIMGPLSKAARRDDRGFLVFEDNDLAVEWCENEMAREIERPQVAKGSLADSVLFRGCHPRCWSKSK